MKTSSFRSVLRLFLSLLSGVLAFIFYIFLFPRGYGGHVGTLLAFLDYHLFDYSLGYLLFEALGLITIFSIPILTFLLPNLKFSYRKIFSIYFSIWTLIASLTIGFQVTQGSVGNLGWYLNLSIITGFSFIVGLTFGLLHAVLGILVKKLSV